jgi:hypothetical protein
MFLSDHCALELSLIDVQHHFKYGTLFFLFSEDTHLTARFKVASHLVDQSDLLLAQKVGRIHVA